MKNLDQELWRFLFPDEPVPTQEEYEHLLKLSQHSRQNGVPVDKITDYDLVYLSSLEQDHLASLEAKPEQEEQT